MFHSLPILGDLWVAWQDSLLNRHFRHALLSGPPSAMTLYCPYG